MPVSAPPTRGVPTALARCVGDVAAFESAWGSHPLHIAGSDPLAFADIFDIGDLDRLLAMTARRPTIRMIANGEPLRPEEYCTTIRLGGRVVDDVVDPRRVSDRLREGATLVMQSLHRTSPTVRRLVADLQEEIGHPVQANAYLTPAGARGLAPHSDEHDVFVLQLHGSKHWNVDALGDVELVAGDSMYVPARTMHSAQAASEASLHLTIGVIRVTYRDVVVRLLEDGPPSLDAPLPLGHHRRAADELRDALDAALSATSAYLADVDSDDIVRREQRRRHRRPFDTGHLASLIDLDRLSPDRRLRWAAATPLARRAGAIGPATWHALDDLSIEEGERIEVHLGHRTITVPAAVLAALRVLADGAPVVVDDLPGLDPPSRLVLARRLVEETACVIEPTIPSAPVPTPTNFTPTNFTPTNSTNTKQGEMTCPTNSKASASRS